MSEHEVSALRYCIGFTRTSAKAGLAHRGIAYDALEAERQAIQAVNELDSLVADHAESAKVIAERAACADIADQHNSCEGIAQKIAAAIRARGKCADDPRLEQAREALKKIANLEDSPCHRCEGNGRLYADGRAHYYSEGAATVACPICGGTGRICDTEEAKRIALAALGGVA